MPNQFNAPEIGVTEVDMRWQRGDRFLLVDVREADELEVAAIEGATHVALSDLRDHGEAAIPQAMHDKDVDCVLFCHKGVRSAKVTAWLMERGYTNVRSMDGGIDAWSVLVDEEVDRY